VTAVDDVTRRATAGMLRWLEQQGLCGDELISLQLLKIGEEAGEAAGAWIGALGSNPRKGVTHSRRDVAAELADVVLTALVAIESLGYDAGQVVTECAEKVLARLPDEAAVS
jgi:phosphoribosyl-ATP pyrophosphohydrolase